MYTVYVLKDKNGKFYKGCTNNLARRLKEHRYGKTITTSKMKNCIVVYTEEYDNFRTARSRERFLKNKLGP